MEIPLFNPRLAFWLLNDSVLGFKLVSLCKFSTGTRPATILIDPHYYYGPETATLFWPNKITPPAPVNFNPFNSTTFSIDLSSQLSVRLDNVRGQMHISASTDKLFICLTGGLASFNTKDCFRIKVKKISHDPGLSI